MRRWSMIAAALVLSCGAAFAQTTTGMSGVAMATPPASGMTPLGTLGGNPPTGNSPTGLPLGATEINPGGLSTTLLPAARAGPTRQVASMNGAFHGVETATTPAGS